MGQYILMVSYHLVCLANYKLLLNFNFNMRNASLLPSDGPLGNIPDKRWRQTWRWVSQIRRTWFIQEKEHVSWSTQKCPFEKIFFYTHYIRHSMRTSLIVLKNESVQWCCYELKNFTMKFSGTELHELMYWSLDCYIIPVSSTDSLTTQQHRVDKMSDSLLCLLTSWWAGLLSQWISLK